MGPIKVEYILDEHRRSQTLTDRKRGLIRKAHELSIMTNTDIFIQLVTQKGRFYGYSFHEREHMGEYVTDGVHMHSKKGTRLQTICLFLNIT